MTKRKPQDSGIIFALDIGTRSIIGIVGRVVDERFQVLAIEKEEHGKRAMLDGQIEDITQVAKVARRVTDRLEEKLDCTLERVCVAAAGRALRTEQGSCTMEFPESVRITNDIIGRLESGAVAEAEAMLGQAYSLLIARVKDGADAPQVARDIYDKVDTAKWICVDADTKTAAYCGDVVMFFMVNSQFADSVSVDTMMEAFKAVCGGNVTVIG